MTITHKYQYCGDITTAEIAEVQSFFERALSQDGNVVIDLHEITDIDLAGFNLLVAAYMKARRDKKGFSYITGKLEKLRFLTEITQLRHVFK